MVNGGGEFALGQDYPNRPIRFSTPAQPIGSAPEQFRDFLRKDLAKWSKIVRESGAKLGLNRSTGRTAEGHAWR